MMKSINATLVIVLLPILLQAQESTDFLRSTGKIYSVVLTVVILFLGIVFYVWRLDQKVKKMEEEFGRKS